MLGRLDLDTSNVFVIVEPFVVLMTGPLLLFPTVRPLWTAIALVALVTVWLARWIVRREPWPVTPFNGALLVFALMIPVGIWASAFPDLTLDKATGLVLGLAVFRAVVFSVRDRRSLAWTVAAFGGLGVAIVAVGLVSAEWLDKIAAVTIIARHIPRLIESLPGSRSVGVAPNQIAAVLALYLPPALTFVLVSWFRPVRAPKTWIIRIISGFSLLFVGSALLLTQSRSGWMGGIAGIIVVAALWALSDRRRVIRRLAWGGTVLLLASSTGLLLRLGPERLGQLMLGTDPSAAALGTMVGGLNTWSFRVDVWRTAVYAVQDFMFTGCGLGTFREVARLLYPLPSISPSYDIAHAHNIFLQTALDLGMAGLIGYLALLGIAANTCRQRARAGGPLTRALCVGLVAGLVGLHVYGLTDALALGAKPAVAFWMALGLVAAVARQTLDLPEA